MPARISVLILICLFASIINPVQSQSFKQVNIEIAQDSIDELESHPYTNEDVHGSFIIDGVSTDTVELHYRGAYFLWQLIRKGSLRNWKVKFEKHQKLENRREWNFNYEDRIQQNLTYQMFEEARVPCVSTENVILSVNGERQGLYLKYEDPDNKDWLEDVFGDDEGDLYKAAYDMPDEEKYFADMTYLGDNDEDYFLHYRKQTNKKREKEFDYSSIREFTASINHTSDEEFRAFIESEFAVDEFIRYLVVANFTANWDGYPYRPKNYFLYNNPFDVRWYFIPWDLDGTFQEAWSKNTIGRTGSVFHYFDEAVPYNNAPNEPLERPLLWRLMAIQEYRDQYIYDYQQAIESSLSQDNLYAIVDSIANSVMANISGGELDKYLATVSTVKEFIEVRLQNVKAELDQYEVENPYLIHVSEVDIPLDSISIYEGNMISLSVELSPDDAEDKRVEWTSSDTLVASVNEVGNVTGLTSGIATITVTSLDEGLNDSCIVTVMSSETVIHVSEVDIPLDSISIYEGNMISLSVELSPDDAEDKRVEWTSSDTLVASVNEEGNVTGLTSGITTITVTSLDEGLYDSCIVTVMSTDTVVTDTVSSIRPEDTRSFMIYPNPAHSYIRFDLPDHDPGNIQIRLINLSGQTLLIKSLSSSGKDNNSFSLELNEIPAGQYIIMVKTAQEIYTEKLSIVPVF